MSTKDDQIENEVVEIKDEKPSKKDLEMIPVTIRATENESAVVEYQKAPGNYERCVVKLAEVQDGKVTRKTLENALQYGIDFANLKLPEISSQDVVNLLHANGLYTGEQIMTDRDKVNRALMPIQRKVLLALIEFVQEL